MALSVLCSRKRATRMLRHYGKALAALAIDSEDAAAAHAAHVFEGMPVPLKPHLAGYAAAVNWNTALRLWAEACPGPAVKVLRPEEPWTEVAFHGVLHLHVARDGIGDPTSDRQQARLAQEQAALLPPYATTTITNVEAVAHRDSDGRVVAMTLCAPLDKETLWSIPVDIGQARRLLHRWRTAGVPWLAHNARIRALLEPAPAALAPATKPAALPQAAPTRRFRPKPQTGTGTSTGS